MTVPDWITLALAVASILIGVAMLLGVVYWAGGEAQKEQRKQQDRRELIDAYTHDMRDGRR